MMISDVFRSLATHHAFTDIFSLHLPSNDSPGDTFHRFHLSSYDGIANGYLECLSLNLAARDPSISHMPSGPWVD